MDTKFTTYPETAPFVEALRLTLQAESKILEGFSGIYGDIIPQSGGKTGGEDMFHRSGLFDLIAETKETLKNWVGNTFELGMAGCLEAPGDPSLTAKKEEGVC